jgi:hypothetical protein
MYRKFKRITISYFVLAFSLSSSIVLAQNENPNFSNTGNNWPLQGRVAYAPAGLVIPITLNTAISTQIAKAGDYIQATISQNVALNGASYIPAGSIITGQVTEAEAGRRLSRSGSLGIQFNQLRLPNGTTIPLSAHVLGNIGKYSDKNNTYHGEGWGTKFEQFALRGALGAGGGAAFGTAVGAIAGGVGRGAWSGAAIGGGIGILDSLVLRKGRNVLISSGTPMQLQLDDPLTLPLTGNNNLSTPTSEIEDPSTTGAL